jgi:hypothetical protein
MQGLLETQEKTKIDVAAKPLGDDPLLAPACLV